ncbi:defective in Cullin neddylation protein 1, partial [Pluteus cervinus]
MGDKKSKVHPDSAQFCSITAASQKDAQNFLDKYKKLDVAIDAFYNDPTQFGPLSPAAPATSTKGLVQIFDSFKDKDGDDITIDGTIRFCEALGVDPEDVVLLAIAYELKSPRLGQWTKQGWIDGWKNLGCDSLAGMKSALGTLRTKLSNDPAYFRKVYGHTFDFARQEGQRSLGTDTAIPFWGLLLAHGQKGGALTRRDGEQDIPMDGQGGWKPAYTDLWFEFLTSKNVKGISKDTWLMFLDFVRTINADFSNYDME